MTTKRPSSSPETEPLPAFFAAADRAYARIPWDTAHDSQILGIEAPESRWPKGACLCLVGTAGDQPALLVFPSLDTYLHFVEELERAQDGGAVVRPQGVLAINFDHKHGAPKDVVRRAKALGLRPANPQAFPWVSRLDAHDSADVDESDLAFATSLLEALASLLEAHPDLFARETLDAPLTAAAGSVSLRAPHEGAPWEWSESALEYYRWWEADTVREEFLTSTASEARSPEDEEALANAVAQLFALKIDHQGVEALAFTAQDASEFLLHYFPEQEIALEKELRQIPERIAHFFRWLGERGRLDPTLATHLADDALRLASEFLTRAQDVTLFGPEKALVLEMKAAGIDPEDRAAVDRFIEEWEARVLLAAAEPQKKWVWKKGDPAPDPKGPCPCGSGQRYKKCCMPR